MKHQQIWVVIILLLLIATIVPSQISAEDTPPPDFPRFSFREFLDQGNNTTAIGVTFRNDSITISSYFLNDSTIFNIPVVYVSFIESFAVPVYRNDAGDVYLPFVLNNLSYDQWKVERFIPVTYDGSNITFSVTSILFESDERPAPNNRSSHGINSRDWKQGSNLATILLERWNSDGRYYVMPIKLASAPAIPLKEVPKALLMSKSQILVSRLILRYFPDIEDGTIMIIFNHDSIKQKYINVKGLIEEGEI